MKVLDLCCKAGGMSMGYYQAGFDVTGVDIEPQPNYPFKFIQADATKLDVEFLKQFDLISASPPCQAYTLVGNRARIHHNKSYPEIIEPIRELLIKSGKPYVIENVPEAPLINTITLCGSSFGLRVRRHRIFESNFYIEPIACNHQWQDENKIYDKYDHKGWYKSGIVSVHGARGKSKAGQHWEEAMGIYWMNTKELTQAIPPAYSKYIGEQFLSWRRWRDGNQKAN